MSRSQHLFDRDPSLSSIHDSLDSFEGEVNVCQQHQRRHRQQEGFECGGGWGHRGGTQGGGGHAQEVSRWRRNEKELSSLRYEVSALKHMFIERNSSMLRLQLALETTVGRLTAESEKMEDRRKPHSSSHSDRVHVSPPSEMSHSGNSTCVFPNNTRSASRSPGDFSFSNKETDETSMFSFGEIDENIEVLRAYTAKYPHDSLDLEDPKPPSPSPSQELLLIPFIYEPKHTGCEPAKTYPILIGETIAERYRIDAIIAATKNSTVLMGYDGEGKRDVCMKVLHNQKEVLDQGLDGIKVWKLLDRQFGDLMKEKHLARMLDFFYYKEHLFVVSELLGENLYVIYSSPSTKALLTPLSIRSISYQLLTALDSFDSLNLIYSDLKPASILLTHPLHKTSRHLPTLEVALADFSQVCFSNDSQRNSVQSLAYRAPEVMLGATYTSKIDIWSLGCILVELTTGELLFPSECSQDCLFQVPPRQIGHSLGAERLLAHPPPSLPIKSKPLEACLPPDDPLFCDFVRKLLTVDPAVRPTAREALHHPYLRPLSEV